MLASDALTALRARRDDDAIPAVTLLGYLGLSQLDIAGRKDFSWLRREYTFSSSGTSDVLCTFTQGQRTATLSAAHTGTFFGRSFYAAAPVGRFFRIVNIDSTRLIITLDRIWPDASGVRTITIINDEYALPYGANRVFYVEVRDGTRIGSPLRLVPIAEIADQFHAGTGTPNQYSTYKRDDLPAPTTAPTRAAGGAGLTGTFLFWMSFYDQRSGWESPLSPAGSITLANQGVDITPGSVRQDFAWRVYRSKAGGSTPFFLAEVNDMSTNLAGQNTPDEYLGPARAAAYSPLLLKLAPAPADTGLDLTALIQVSPPPVLSTTDPILVPDEFLHTLLDGAELYQLGYYEEDQRSGAVRARYEAGIARMLKRDMPSAARINMASRRSKRQGGTITPISAEP